MTGTKQLEEAVLSKIRSDFPILAEMVNGKPLAYLDNAATAQKPLTVIEAVSSFYRNHNANIHRAVHVLSQAATERYEGARKLIGKRLNSRESGEIIFTRGATEAVNLVASSFVEPLCKKGACILITEMEHHANIVPWQLLEERYGVELVPVKVTDNGEIDLDDYRRQLVEKKPIFVSLIWVSNALGTINPIEEMVRLAKSAGAPVLVDAAQAISHFPVDVQALDCDFLVFSGHKVFGPTGIGVLYGRMEMLAQMRPYQGGGDMIEQVKFGGTTFKGPPERFEAGTPNIAGAIGLASGLQYIEDLDRGKLLAHEEALLVYATEQLSSIDGLQIIGPKEKKVSVISFTMKNAHPHDIGTFLDADGIAVRTGHHCCQPLMQRLGLTGTARASFAFYNTMEEVDRLVRGLDKINQFFG